MQPSLTLDLREWQRAAKELFTTSSRTCVDFTNGQAYRVATLAVKETHRADAAKISRELGAVGRDVSFKTLSRGKNKGKTRTVRGDYILANNDTLASRILGARHKLTGSFGVKGETMDDRAKNLIRARAASSNFVRAAWIPAIRKLNSVVKKKPSKVGSVSGVKQKGVDKGHAIPAKFSVRSLIESEIGIKLFKKPTPPEKSGDPIKTATAGLRVALNLAAKDMIAELARRLDPDFKKVSAK